MNILPEELREVLTEFFGERPREPSETTCLQAKNKALTEERDDARQDREHLRAENAQLAVMCREFAPDGASWFPSPAEEWLKERESALQKQIVKLHYALEHMVRAANERYCGLKIADEALATTGDSLKNKMLIDVMEQEELRQGLLRAIALFAHWYKPDLHGGGGEPGTLEEDDTARLAPPLVKTEPMAAIHALKKDATQPTTADVKERARGIIDRNDALFRRLA